MMDFTRIRVLLLDGSGKQTLAMLRGLKEIGCHVTVLCATKLDTCYLSNKPDRKILNDKVIVRDEKAYQELLSLVKTGDFDVVMPVGELGTNFVTDHEEELKKYVKLACAPREVYIRAFNKQTTFDQAMRSGVPCSYTRRSDQNIADFLLHCRFPIIIKPRQGLGSIGFHKFETEDEFRSRLADSSFNVDDYVVQEFVTFENRISANLFLDQNGNICTAYAVNALRWFPIDAGAGVLSETVDAHDVIKYAGKLLHDLGWKGFAQVAFMVDKYTGGPKLLEINGRIPASIKMAYMCGFNISRQMLEMIYDEPVIQYPENTKFGLYIRHFDTDLAWFFKSRDRFRAKPSWFSWKNTKEVIYSKDDPKPFWGHLFQRVFRYKSIMRRKKH
ncbi:MAG: ATP-grasp domain-containing protein [Lachnospiraceae bacterium]|nr:ATP-grasp domain-containing protein [Lachnospiraceae bacterium]